MPSGTSRFAEEFLEFADAPDPAPPPSTSALTPGPSARKRRRVDDEDDEDEQEDELEDEENDAESGAAPSRSSTPHVNKNYIDYARSHAKAKRLRPEQVEDVVAFVSESAIVREIKLYTLLLSLELKQDAKVAEKVAWAPSHELIVNIREYALGVLLSSRLSSYKKGKVSINHVANLVLRYRLYIPPNIERDAAAWKKVMKVIKNELTECRRKIKDLVILSVKGPNAEHWTIYQLTRRICDINGKCQPSVPLCTRIALMRKLYLANPGRDFYDDLDNELAEVRRIATSDERRAQRIFSGILNKDRNTHGVADSEEEPEVPEFTGEWQSHTIDEAM